MNRSHSRFVPHSRPVHPGRNAGAGRQANHVRPATVNRPAFSQRTSRPAAVSRPVFQQRASRPAAVSRPAYHQRISHAAIQARKQSRSYWFPIATMMAAVLFAVSAVIPGSIFDAFASSDTDYSFGIESKAGAYSVTLTGGNSTSIDLPAENAEKTVNSDGTVTFAIDLDEETNYTIESPAAMTSISFDDAAPAEAESDAPVVVKSAAEGEENEEDEEEAEEETPAKAGVEAVTSIDLSKSGASSLDISECTGLTNVSLAGNTDLTESAFTNITYGSQDNLTVSLDTPVFEYADRGEQGKGYFFDAVGAGDVADLTAKLYGDIPVAKEDGRFYISFDNLDATFAAVDSHGAPESEIYVTNSTKPGVTYKMFFHAGSVPEYMEPDTNPATDTTENGNVSSNSETEPTAPSDDNPSDDNESPNVKLTVDTNSKNVIKDAYIENVSSVKPSELKIVAKALSTADKKTFLAAVKKKDKDFNDSDANLLVYNLYVVDSKGNKVDLKGKAAATVTLAYPSYQVEYLKDEYEFKVYHQLADKSIDTGIDAYPTKDGIQFSTDSFSNFAVSSTKKEQNYTDLVVHDNSKKIISSAKAHEGTYFTVDEEAYADTHFTADQTWIIAEAPTAEEKKDFFEAIKKVNKDFNEKDTNLIVYKVSLKNIQIDQPSKMSPNSKVDFTLVYPNDNLKKNYTKYSYTVYHQLADKSIDTKQLAVGGKDGITVTTDGFSLFAVASTIKPSGSDVPKTGESNVAANIAMLLAMLSMVSFIGVYAKNKAEQY